MNFEDLVYVTGPFIRNFFFGILLRVIFEGIQLLADRFILQPLIGPNLPNPAPAAWNCHLISRWNPTIFAVHCSKTKVVLSNRIVFLWYEKYFIHRIEDSKETICSHNKINQNKCWRLIWYIFLKNDIYEASHFSTAVCYPWHFYALSHWILVICFANNFESE